MENEATLEKRIGFTANILVICGVCFVFLVVSVALAISVIAFSPLKSSLPGYMKESERTATEEQHLRLDSLLHVYEMNEAYMQGILKALNPPEIDSTKLNRETVFTTISPDSLLPMSNEEKNFLEIIRERDKYNISLSSLQDAEALMFQNVSPAAVISEASKNSTTAELIIPSGAPVEAVAEGKVISVALSSSNPGLFEIIIQHPKGFISKTSRLAFVNVTPGQRVTAGQAIASTSSHSAQKSNNINFELWHDATPLLPYKFLNFDNSKEENENDQQGEQI